MVLAAVTWTTTLTPSPSMKNGSSGFSDRRRTVPGISLEASATPGHSRSTISASPSDARRVNTPRTLCPEPSRRQRPIQSRPMKSRISARALSVSAPACWRKPCLAPGKKTRSTRAPAFSYTDTKSSVISVGTLSSSSG